MSEKTTRRVRRSVKRTFQREKTKFVDVIKKEINSWPLRDRFTFAWRALRGKL